MKNLKKIAAFLAAMTLSLSAFTSCGGDAPSESTPTTEAVTEATTEATTVAATEATTMVSFLSMIELIALFLIISIS